MAKAYRFLPYSGSLSNRHDHASAPPDDKLYILESPSTPVVTNRTETGQLSRRQLLLGVGTAGLTAASSGCLRRARSVISRESPGRVSLSITCVPAEEDPYPVQIAGHLREHLDAVGVSTSVNYRSLEEHRFDVLLNNDFDIAVGRLPPLSDPDALYALFHSSFVPERGWQNPFGFASARLDEKLEEQRTVTSEQRRIAVNDVLEILASEQPIVPVVFPVEHRVVRDDRYDGFDSLRFDTSLDVLSLDPVSRRETLRFNIGFTAPTKNLNPISVEHRTTRVVTGLLYDSLLVRDGDDDYPWLAESVDWAGDTAVVSLREAFWHDGEPVTSADVVFSYRLLRDTTLGEGDSPEPAPLFRGRSTLVEGVEATDERTLEFRFDGSREVIPRAFTVPVLPEHEWESRTESADVAGLQGNSNTAEALVTPNIPPIGSGPYQFVDRNERDDVELELVEDHFSTRVDELSKFEPPATSVEVVVAPSETDAIQNVVDGNVDFTLSPISPEDVDSEFDADSDAVVTQVPAHRLYYVGYNTRREPLSNVSFRRAVSQLLDKSWISTAVFGGESLPTTTLLPDDGWVPEELQWKGADSELPFLGTDGTLDTERARAAFVDIGYQYEDGELRGTTES